MCGVSRSLQYQECHIFRASRESVQYQEGHICSTERKLCSVRKECTVSGGLQLLQDDKVCGVKRKSSL